MFLPGPPWTAPHGGELQPKRNRVSDRDSLLTTPSNHHVKRRRSLAEVPKSGRSDEGSLHLTGVARSEVCSVAEHGLERVGLFGGDDGTDLASEVDDEADLLLRSLRVEVGPVPRVARSPDAPLAGPNALDLDALEALDLDRKSVVE